MLEVFVFTALEAVGLETYILDEESHHAAKLPGDSDDERRIDILIATGEPWEH